MAVNIAEERIEREHEHEPDAERHADIQWCVHAEVHTRKRREHDHNGTDHAQPRPPRPAAEAAEGGKDILRVPARERVAGGLGAGALDDLKIRVLHPWARDAEHQLEKLIDDRADEADCEHIVPAGFAHAPEHNDGDGHEHDLAAAVGECAEHRVQKRCAQLRQRIKQLHENSLPSVYFCRHYSKPRRRIQPQWKLTAADDNGRIRAEYDIWRHVPWTSKKPSAR